LSRPNLSEGWDEIVFSRSTVPRLVFARSSQKRSSPPLQTIQALRPRISAELSAMPPSMSWK
jgi:hypothetical protein